MKIVIIPFNNVLCSNHLLDTKNIKIKVKKLMIVYKNFLVLDLFQSISINICLQKIKNKKQKIISKYILK